MTELPTHPVVSDDARLGVVVRPSNPYILTPLTEGVGVSGGAEDALRQGGQLRGALRQQVGLQIEHDLQTVLDLSQETVVLFENRPLLHVQAASVLQIAIFSLAAMSWAKIC